MKNTTLVIGGTAGLGREVAERCAARGEQVTIAGRDPERAQVVAAEIGGETTGIKVDLGSPDGISADLEKVASVDHLVISSAGTSSNSVRDFDLASALRFVNLKLVGYAEVVHALVPRLGSSASIVLFGGQAMARPYPGSTMVTTANAGVSGLVRAMASELAPVRVNAIHPGVIGDSPRWIDKDTSATIARSPIGRLVTMAEVASAVLFLLDNPGMNGADLVIDGGWLLG
ncbi:MAG: SDR family NAD(P)-dependent oxidoreductase [Acidimicrobiales bacterium]